MHECFCNLRRFFLPSRFFWCRHKKWGLTVTPYPNESGTIIWKNLEFTFMIWFEKCRLRAKKKLAQLGIFPLLEKDPYFLLAPSIDAGPRDSVSLQNTQKSGRSQLFFRRVFFSYCSYLLHWAFVCLAACFLLTLRTPKMATFMSPIFLPEHLVQHTVIDLLSFLLVFCKGQRYTADMPQCRSCQHEK